MSKEKLMSGLLQAWERDEKRFAQLKEAAKYVVEAYDAENFVRTADFHPEECTCFRCRMDHLRYMVYGN